MTNDLKQWIADLNDPQREAVEYDGGPLLILAGAGSGKTRVIVHRIARLIDAAGASPRSILAVTFTNKAAQEMRERVGQLLGFDASGVTVSTFHSLGARILREKIELLGYPREFTIYDDSDQLSLMKTVIKDHGLDPKKVTPKSLRNWVDAIKREAFEISDVARYPDPKIERYVPLITTYQERMKECNAVDFGDLLLLTHKLLNDFPESAK